MKRRKKRKRKSIRKKRKKEKGMTKTLRCEKRGEILAGELGRIEACG